MGLGFESLKVHQKNRQNRKVLPVFYIEMTAFQTLPPISPFHLFIKNPVKFLSFFLRNG